MRLLRTLVVLGLLASRLAAAQPETTVARFTTVDVVVDAGAESLAAFQVEIVAGGDAKIVGVEGGDHAAFNSPPYYDPAALQGGRIIIAAFSTSTSLPSGRVRVAVLHMREAGTVTYSARLLAAARGDGSRFAPAISVVPGGEQ
jgi:hypothetical protein